jgi:hypothetical protein
MISNQLSLCKGQYWQILD